MGYWLTHLMGASLRSFTHPTKNAGLCRMGKAQRTHQSVVCGE
jgi:hypothetical protein